MDSEALTRPSRPKIHGHLLRVLGVGFGWAVTVGNTIGAGILRAPGEVAAAVPSQVLFFLIWVAGGAYALLGALSLAELGTMSPESGGQTVFVRRAFGPHAGFAVAWSDWLSTAASAAAIAIVLVDAVVALLPILDAAHPALAPLLLLGFGALQWRGVRAGSNAQLMTSALKAVAFLALIAACFFATPQRTGFAATSVVTAAGIVASLQLMIYTYDGWAGALYFSGEYENPSRDIPRSMVMGVVSVLVIYLLVNAAFLYLIPLGRMAGDPLVADTVSKIVFGTAGTAMLRALIAVSLLSAINACILMASRIAYAAAARRVNPGGTPTYALAATILLAIGFAATGTFNQVIAMAAFFFVANYAASFASVFRLRRIEPAAQRPYRAWGYPVTTGVVLAGSVAFLLAVMITDPRSSALAIALLALSVPIHRWTRTARP